VVNLRESRVREICMHGLGGGGRPARKRASSDPTTVAGSVRAANGLCDSEEEAITAVWESPQKSLRRKVRRSRPFVGEISGRPQESINLGWLGILAAQSM